MGDVWVVQAVLSLVWEPQQLLMLCLGDFSEDPIFRNNKNMGLNTLGTSSPILRFSLDFRATLSQVRNRLPSISTLSFDLAAYQALARMDTDMIVEALAGTVEGLFPVEIS